MDHRITPYTIVPTTLPQTNGLWAETCQVLPSDVWIRILQLLPSKTLHAWSRLCKAAWILSWDQRVWGVFQNRFHPYGPLETHFVKGMRRQAWEWDLWSQKKITGLEEIHVPPWDISLTFIGFADNHTPLFKTWTGSLVGIELTTFQKKDFSTVQPTEVARSPDFFFTKRDLENLPMTPLDKERGLRKAGTPTANTQIFIKIPPSPYHLPKIYNISPDGKWLVVGYTFGLIRLINTHDMTSHVRHEWDFDQIQFLSIVGDQLLVGWCAKEKLNVNIYPIPGFYKCESVRDVNFLFIKDGLLYYNQSSGFFSWDPSTSKQKSATVPVMNVHSMVLYHDQVIILTQDRHLTSFRLPSLENTRMGFLNVYCPPLTSNFNLSTQGPYLISTDGQPLYYLPTLDSLFITPTSPKAAKLLGERYILFYRDRLRFFIDGRISDFSLYNVNFGIFYGDRFIWVDTFNTVFSLDLNADPKSVKPKIIHELPVPVLSTTFCEPYLILVTEQTPNKKDGIFILDLKTPEQWFCQFDVPVNQAEGRRSPFLTAELRSHTLVIRIDFQSIELNLETKTISRDLQPASFPPKPASAEIKQRRIYQNRFIVEGSQQGFNVFDIVSRSRYQVENLPSEAVLGICFQNQLICFRDPKFIFFLDLLTGKVDQIKNEKGSPFTHIELGRKGANEFLVWLQEASHVEVLHISHHEQGILKKSAIVPRLRGSIEQHCEILIPERLILVGELAMRFEGGMAEKFAEQACHLVKIEKDHLKVRYAMDLLMQRTENYLLYSRGKGIFFYDIKDDQELRLFTTEKNILSCTKINEECFELKFEKDFTQDDMTRLAPRVLYYFNPNLRTFSDKEPLKTELEEKLDVLGLLQWGIVAPTSFTPVKAFQWEGSFENLRIKVEGTSFKVLSQDGKVVKEANSNAKFAVVPKSIVQIGDKLLITTTQQGLYFMDLSLNVSLVSENYDKYFVFQQYLIVEKSGKHQFFDLKK